TVNVSNELEPPTLEYISDLNVTGDIASGTLLATMSVSTAGSQDITNYIFSSGNDKGYFDINSTGSITVSPTAHFHYYEQDMYTLEISAITTDGNGTSTLYIVVPKADQVYLRNVVYDNNYTTDVSDDNLYIYFDSPIAETDLAAAPGDDFNITGDGIIGSGSNTEYNISNYYRYKISLNDEGTQSNEFNTSGDRIAIKDLEITDLDQRDPNNDSITVNRFTPVKKTGQNDPEDGNYTDGYYAKGITPSYTRDDTNDIVTDNITGYMWQDDSSASSVTKRWVTTANYNAGNYEDTSGDTATTYCSTLSLGGYSDWRLPSRAELLTIVDRSRYSPAIDPVFQNTASYYYWSSSTNASNTSLAWYVYFNSGSTDYYRNKYYSYYVRCVRSGQ
ncbi:MAG: DUF1566 domain-containing protein, partial [Campylobacterota bacterium]|nr:DUF1566 domain-containing protein [Campylobacterota bacterium]